MSSGLDPNVPRSYTFTGNTTDSYQFLYCPGTTTVTLQISNAQIDVGFGVGATSPGSGVYNPTDETYLPVMATLNPRNCNVIRFKSHAAGVPAQVTIIARP